MQYPITTVLNKAKDEILRSAKDVSNKYNIPMDLMAFVVDDIRADIYAEAMKNLSNINIEALNEIDKLTNENEELKAKVKEDDISD